MNIFSDASISLNCRVLDEHANRLRDGRRQAQAAAAAINWHGCAAAAFQRGLETVLGRNQLCSNRLIELAVALAHHGRQASRRSELLASAAASLDRELAAAERLVGLL